MKNVSKYYVHKMFSHIIILLHGVDYNFRMIRLIILLLQECFFSLNFKT